MPNETTPPPRPLSVDTFAMGGRTSSFDEVRSPLLPSPGVGAEESTTRATARTRRLLGLLCLLITVFLWTASSFLASTLFADNTYTKPYLVTYVNTAFFIIPLPFLFLHRAYRDPDSIKAFARSWRRRLMPSNTGKYEDEAVLKPDNSGLFSRLRAPHPPHYCTSDDEAEDMLLGDPLASSQVLSIKSSASYATSKLSLGDTARLSLEFCFLWFLANYLISGCLEHTTVASSTIITSTSSIFTLLFGAVFRVERFSLRKLLGVVASLAGIVLISTVDLSGNNDENRGSFPHKSVRQVALGDGMALVSAVLYGVYAVFMKKRIGDESKVDMPLFFGLVGLFNVLLLWPGFIILHFTGVETFELPPTGRVVAIIVMNSAASFISDIAWAYAVLLTSPIVVTVGLSTTIPLSLIGQFLLHSQTVSALYWFGAGIVVLSFVFINHESKEESITDHSIRAGHVVLGPEDGVVVVER